MGVNIDIDVPGWDKFATGGMRTIAGDNERLPKVYRPSPLGSDPGNLNGDFRPSDFALWRKSLVGLDTNVAMWLSAMDAMKANPDLWASWSS